MIWTELNGDYTPERGELFVQWDNDLPFGYVVKRKESWWPLGRFDRLDLAKQFVEAVEAGSIVI